MKRVRQMALAAGVVALLSLSACGKDSATVVPGLEAVSVAEPTVPAAVHTVTFFSDDGSVLLIDSVPEGEPAAPPAEPEMTYGSIFTGWTTDFTSMTGDTDVHPSVESVRGRENVFAIPATYGRKGETVSIPLLLCGDVSLCGFDLTVGYDAASLSLEEIFNEDGALVYNDETPGQIRMNFVSVENVEADVDLCWMKFRVLSDSGDIPIHLTVHDVYAGNGDDMVSAEYDLIQGMLHVFG